MSNISTLYANLENIRISREVIGRGGDRFGINDELQQSLRRSIRSNSIKKYAKHTQTNANWRKISSFCKKKFFWNLKSKPLEIFYFILYCIRVFLVLKYITKIKYKKQTTKKSLLESLILIYYLYIDYTLKVVCLLSG